MCTDNYICLAALELTQRRLLLLFRAEARHHIDGHGKRSHAREQRLIMLKRKNRRRHEDRGLISVLRRFESRSERDLGFSVAHISAEQTIHRVLPLHVGFDILNRAELPVRLFIFERSGKFGGHFRIRRKRDSLRAAAARIKLDQLLCHFAACRLCLRLCAVPIRAAHFGKLDSRAVRRSADIL